MTLDAHSEDTKDAKQRQWVHDSAALWSRFYWQNEEIETKILRTTIVQFVPGEGSKPPTYLVYVEAVILNPERNPTYPIQRWVAVRKPQQEWESEVTDLTEEQKAMLGLSASNSYYLVLDEELAKELHTALDSVLSLFVADHGFDSNSVDIALEALRKSRDRYNLPVTVALSQKIDRREQVAHEKKRFEKELEQSASSLKEMLDLHGEATNRAHAWGYSPDPIAKRLPDGKIEVTTYHFEDEWETDILDTELDAVYHLYKDGNGGWDPGKWKDANEQ